MSLEAFLAEVNKVEGGGSNAFITIAKARVFFCWQGWTSGQSTLFEFEPNNDESEVSAKVECQAYIDSGSNEYVQWPQKGICTHIYGDDVPTNAEGKFHWGDILDFVKKYESDLNAPNNLTEDELRLVSDPMPFNLVVEAIKANTKVADWKDHWVRMSQEVNQWSKAKGKTNKKGYDLRVHVIQHVYANEVAAKADVGQLAKDDYAGRITQANSPNSRLSKEAIAAWGGKEQTHEAALAYLLGNKAEIENLIENATEGIGIPKKDDPQAYAASGYNIEVDDLALLGIGISDKTVEVAPF